jgi:macrolide transport system ATP-binding/permease protein
VALWQELGRRVAFLTRQFAFERELDAEIQFHIDTRADELAATGMTRSDALSQARREFGSSARVREATRAAWQFRWLEGVFADLRYAFRGFRRTPAFTLTAIVSLAAGIGANSAIFAALDAVLWKPLPVADPHSLVRFSPGALPLAYVDQLRRSGIFADLITTAEDGLSFAYDDRAERIEGQVVSPNFFTFLGIEPILGQGFTADVRAGVWSPEAVLSYRFWKRRFGGDPGVVGRIIHLNAYPFTIVGVSPPPFFDLTQGSDPELRVPLLPDGRELSQIRLLSGSMTRSMAAMARLTRTRTVTQAEGAADAQFQEFLRTHGLPTGWTAGYRHLRLLTGSTGGAGQLGQFRAPLFLLLALVTLVLVIACANVANLLLARGTARHRELAVRASIGAGRARLVRQMLAESVLLALCGGALGVVVADWVTTMLVRFLPQGHSHIVIDLHPDVRVLMFSLLLSLITGLLFGVVPALQVTRGDLAASLKADSASSVGSRGAGIRKTLVVSQVAFSLVLLIVAGLFVRTLSNLRPDDFHVRADRVLLFTMKPQRELYDPNRFRQLAAELLHRVTGLPGVQSAALAENGPLGSRDDVSLLEAPGGDSVQAAVDWITPGFFETIGVPRIAGRDFTEGDAQGALPVVIVNAALARALFNNENPIGRTVAGRVALGVRPQDRNPRQFTIVGIVADAHYYDVHLPPPPAAWFAIQQDTPYMPTLHVRTATADTNAVMSAVRHEFDALDKGFPVFNIKTLGLRIEDSLSRERMVADISAGFGLLALLLAGVGLYGILAYSVSRRTREIGIRVALGSSTVDIVWLIGREALILVTGGAVVGIAISTLAGHLLARYLFGVSSTDPAALLASAAAMLLIATIAVSIPAYRASRVDPLVALRSD